MVKRMQDTRERILLEALNLFSTKGYDAVSVRDIAGVVGIKESSLYNHFKSKQDIFDSIIAEYSQRGTALFEQTQIIEENKGFAVDNRTIEMYRNMTNEQFTAIVSHIFEFYFADEVSVKLRKMLTIEQYRNERIGKLYRDLSFDDAIDFQSKLFAALIEAGHFVKTDPYMLAMAFFSPIFLIFYKYDNNESSLAQAKELFIRHIEHFDKTYGSHNTDNRK